MVCGGNEVRRTLAGSGSPSPPRQKSPHTTRGSWAPACLPLPLPSCVMWTSGLPSLCPGFPQLEIMIVNYCILYEGCYEHQVT